MTTITLAPYCVGDFIALANDPKRQLAGTVIRNQQPDDRHVLIQRFNRPTAEAVLDQDIVPFVVSSEEQAG